MSASRVPVCALALLLNACAVGPQFETPAAPASTQYTSASADAPASVAAQHVQLGAAVPGEWWNLFKHAPLNELVAQALANNRSLAAAQATVQRAQALTEASTGQRYPQVDLTAGVGRQQLGAQFIGSFGQLPPFTYYAFGAAVRYTLDYTGGVAREVEQQRALLAYQEQRLQAARLAVSGNVVLRAIELAAIEAEIHTVEELLNEDRRNLDMIQAAFDAGSVSRVDVLTAQNELASDGTLLPPLRQRASQARHALAVLLAREPAAVDLPVLELTAFELPSQLPVALPSELVHRRPDILAAEAQLHAATAAVGVATANLYPRITLSASFGQQSVEPGELFDAGSEAWSLISGLIAPVFDGGRLRAERRAALAALSTDAARYRQVVLESFAQVADALSAIEHSGELLAAQSQAVQVAQQTLELTRDSYNEGNVGVLQVLDSERSYQRARLGLVRAQAQRLHDTAQLFVALGHST